MAPPTPWKILKAINMKVETDVAQRREESVKVPMPHPKTLRLPKMSASLPKGTRHTPDARR
jgi:hypothetical protein